MLRLCIDRFSYYSTERVAAGYVIWKTTANYLEILSDLRMMRELAYCCVKQNEYWRLFAYESVQPNLVVMDLRTKIAERNSVREFRQIPAVVSSNI